ncbi:alpha/beta fold hydrolase [Streptomyces antibioticus]|uniref:alpha/beta fold hydrolase n=1 Tax=Streptomyces antibioticus TaxID=1890 RepID=UPI0033DE9CF5
MTALATRGYRAVAPNQRGHSPGARPLHAADYSIGALVDDVVSIAEALGWTTFDLVGHDWGGAVAWWTAYAHPGRVRTLTVVPPPHPGALAVALRIDEDQRTRSHCMRDSARDARDGGPPPGRRRPPPPHPLREQGPAGRRGRVRPPPVPAGRPHGGPELVPRRPPVPPDRHHRRTHAVRLEHPGHGLRPDGGPGNGPPGHRPVSFRNPPGHHPPDPGGGPGRPERPAPGTPQRGGQVGISLTRSPENTRLSVCASVSVRTS